jgi:phosphoglycerol transferase MdoB-like AlkP superfamily enzyme
MHVVARSFLPYSIFLRFALFCMVLLSLSRICLMAWQWPRVTAAGDVGWFLWQGLRADLILIGLWLALPVLMAPFWFSWQSLAATGFAQQHRQNGWYRFSYIWCLVALTVTIFIELSSASFIAQYDVRPNRLYIEYLKYPKEVFSTLWHGFRAPLIGGIVATGGLLWAACRWLMRASVLKPQLQPQIQPTLHPALHSTSPWTATSAATTTERSQATAAAAVTSAHTGMGWAPLWSLLLMWVCVLFVVFACIRSTTNHRPANPAMFAMTGDALVNSLIINSPYSVFYAAYSMRHEARSTQMYGQLPTNTMLKLALDWPWLQHYQFKHADFPTLHQQTLPEPPLAVQHPSDTSPRLFPLGTPTRPRNLVIVLQESMGATFVGKLGGVGVTPELDKLATQGIWFEQMYATGTRSVRGIEAVVAGFAPTPAQSVVKLSNSQQNFTTLASILAQQGYHTQFIYGGEAHFDNMRSFFTGNGFSQVVDIHQIKNPAFVGSWGASDEDLFNTAHQQLLQLHQQQKPFFSLIFTSSNHEPFEFPEGRIALYDPQKASVNNAVKYADWAMGEFFQKAKQSAYWQDTLFLIVADHDNRVYGNNLIPLEKFQIPAVIVGGDVPAVSLPNLASQIDLAPTLLSLMGIASCHPMIGRDFVADSQSPGRALVQFDNYFALMEEQGLTILLPNGEAKRARFNAHAERSKRHLELLAEPVTQAHYEKALAQVMLPSFLYRERKYPAHAQCAK